MKLQQRDYDTLRRLAEYFLLNRHQIQSLCYPSDSDGRITRRRLAAMTNAGYLRRTKHQVPSPLGGNPCPAYHLSATGRDEIAKYDDDAAILAKPVQLRQPNHLEHQLAVSHFQTTLRAAIDEHPAINLIRWCNEYEPVNPLDDSDQHRTLFSELRVRPRLVCNPDAGFVLEYNENRVVYYLERERGGTGGKQLYQRKHKGYDDLKRQQGHCGHFPETTFPTGFVVLCVAQSPAHRKVLLKAFAGQPAAPPWRFAAVSELTSETILTSPLWYHPDREAPGPLVQTVD